MYDSSTISRSLVIKVLLGLLVIFGFMYALTHSMVVIKAVGDEEKTVRIYWGEGESQQKQFTLKQGSKSLLLPAGPYAVEITSGEKYTRYDKKAGRFSRQTVNVEVEAQKKSTALGVAPYSCSVSKNLGQDATYYPCSPSGGTVLGIKSGKAILGSNPGGLAPSESESEEGTSSVLKPYRDGFLEAAAQNNILYMRERSLNGNLKSAGITEVKGFTGRLDDSVFAVAGDARTTRISILDKERKELWLFDSPADTSPQKVDLADELADLNEVQAVAVIADRNAARVVVSRDPGALETHDAAGEEAPSIEKSVEEANSQQKIITVSYASAEVSDVHDLPKTLVVRKLVGNANGTLLFVPHYADKPKAYLFADKQLSELPFAANDIQDACWKNLDNLYYSSGDQNQIFRYSLSKQAAFLVYENPSASIGRLSCAFDEVSFTLEAEDDGIVDEQVHYQLTDLPMTGGRLESVLPTYLKVDGTVLKASQEQLAVRLDIVVGAPPTPEKAQQELFRYLEGQAVKTSDLVVNSSF